MNKKYNPIIIILFISLVITGWLIVNYRNTTFSNAGYIYAGLTIIAIVIYAYAPKLL